MAAVSRALLLHEQAHDGPRARYPVTPRRAPLAPVDPFPGKPRGALRSRRVRHAAVDRIALVVHSSLNLMVAGRTRLLGRRAMRRMGPKSRLRRWIHHPNKPHLPSPTARQPRTSWRSIDRVSTSRQVGRQRLTRGRNTLTPRGAGLGLTRLLWRRQLRWLRGIVSPRLRLERRIALVVFAMRPQRAAHTRERTLPTFWPADRALVGRVNDLGCRVGVSVGVHGVLRLEVELAAVLSLPDTASTTQPPQSGLLHPQIGTFSHQLQEPALRLAVIPVDTVLICFPL